jgi:PAS domain-containing protein
VAAPPADLSPQPPSYDALIKAIQSSRQSLIIEEARKDPRWRATPDDPVRSVVVVPLLGRLDLVGLLALTHEQPGYFKPDDLLLLEAIASQAAIAVENARLYAGTTLEHRRLEAVLQSAAAPVLVFDDRGHLESLNPAAESLFTDRRPVIGQQLDAGKGSDALFKLLREAIDGGRPEARDIVWRDERVFSARITAVKDGGWVATLHDVSHFNELLRRKDRFVITAAQSLKDLAAKGAELTRRLLDLKPLNDGQAEMVSQISTTTGKMEELAEEMLEAAGASVRPARPAEA